MDEALTDEAFAVKAFADYTVACDDEDECKSTGMGLVAKAIARLAQETDDVIIKLKGLNLQFSLMYNLFRHGASQLC